MKKVFAVVLAMAMVISLSLTSFAESGKPEKSGKSTESSAAEHGKKSSDPQKQFFAELNTQKKELQQQKTLLNQQKEALETQYEALVASGDTANAEAVLADLNTLNEQISGLQAQIKETINERYMVVKTLYSDAELSEFDSAAELIAQMYQDAKVLSADCVTVNNNLIKFDAPPYIKGGVTLVPLRAVSEELGAEVSWDVETKTVTVVKDNTVIEITVNETTVSINGTQVDVPIPAEITCGRTYLPLRFLAEILDFSVSWDGDNQLIDIDGDPSEETPSEEEPSEEPAEPSGDPTAPETPESPSSES